ncbi:MAG: glycosyltransferase family 2 protein [Acidimicrobiia bacterium]
MTIAVGAPVSIVVSVRNEAQSLGRVLDACLAQDYEGQLEVIVAYAASSDTTREILANYEAQHEVVVVDNPNGTAPSGLNAAIAAASGDVIVRCDGHAVLPSDYVSTAVATLARTGAGNVGGIQRAVGVTATQRAIARAMTNRAGVGNATFHRGGSEGPTDTVYLGVFDRAALDEVGGFDANLVRNQDYELNIRLKNADWQVWLDPSLEVEYTPRSTLGSLWRQYYDYGTWKRQVIAMYPDSLRARQAAPPILVAALAGSVVLAATRRRRVGLGFIGSYLAALGAVGVYEAVRSKDPAALLTGPAVGVMHVAWGIGFLTGKP